MGLWVVGRLRERAPVRVDYALTLMRSITATILRIGIAPGTQPAVRAKIASSVSILEVDVRYRPPALSRSLALCSTIGFTIFGERLVASLISLVSRLIWLSVCMMSSGVWCVSLLLILI